MVRTFDGKRLGFRQTVKYVLRSVEANKKRVLVDSVVGKLLIEQRDKCFTMSSPKEIFTR